VWSGRQASISVKMADWFGGGEADSFAALRNDNKRTGNNNCKCGMIGALLHCGMTTRTGNDKGKCEIQGFFALLRMTTF